MVLNDSKLAVLGCENGELEVSLFEVIWGPENGPGGL